MQENAITKEEGPCVVFAGAGTGKTYTIIEKLKYLIRNKKYIPEKIVCLTFSNEAANTLRDRLVRALQGTQEPIIRTFHGFCSELLKKHGENIRLNPDFRILIPDEAKIMLHKNLKVHPLLCGKYVETIGVAKDLGITAEEIERYIEKEKKRAYSDDLKKSVESMQFELNTRHARGEKYMRGELEEKRERLKQLSTLLKLQKFVRIWGAYEKLKKKKGLFDYADLNVWALELLRKKENISKEYEYLIVDEFQDTNKMQFDLLVLLAHQKNITVVGDLNQSIYRFRGAYRENITAFKEKFDVKQKDIFALEKSYRSPNTVLRTAHKLIRKEPHQFLLKNAYGNEGEKVNVYELKNEKEETRKIIEIIENEIERGIKPEEICVIFRTHNQSQRLKKSCEEKKIPYAASAKRSLLAQPTIQKIINFLSLADDKNIKRKGSEMALWSLLHSYNISGEDLALVGREIKKESGENLLQRLEKKPLSEPARIALETIKKIVETIEKAIEEKKSCLELLDLVKNKALSFEITQEEENVLRLREWVETYVKTEGSELSDILYHVSIMEKLGIILEAAPDEQKGIRIMTNHATKGLEYDVVILTNLAEGRFPSERARSNEIIPSALMPDIAEKLRDVPDYAKGEVIESIEKEALLAEERRLAYVAFTRTKQRLYLTYAQEYGARSYAPSQFLKTIEYTTNPDITYVQELEEKTALKSPLLKQALELSKKGPRKKTFSPSALFLFIECQKKYEYKYLYGMPEKEPLSQEEINLGSFIHKVIEEGIKNGFIREEDFLMHARIKYTKEEWNDINLDDALAIIRVFYHRNKHKYTRESRTEQRLQINLEGIEFEGYADRIDIHPEGLEIVDYKTGKAFITARHRNWQLGLYALAAAELGLGPVKKMTLDMLRQEKPLEFELDEEGIARDINFPRTAFALEEVKRELVQTAKKIQDCYEKGFEPCDIEDNCEFCNEFIWKI